MTNGPMVIVSCRKCGNEGGRTTGAIYLYIFCATFSEKFRRVIFFAIFTLTHRYNVQVAHNGKLLLRNNSFRESVKKLVERQCKMVFEQG